MLDDEMRQPARRVSKLGLQGQVAPRQFLLLKGIGCECALDLYQAVLCSAEAIGMLPFWSAKQRVPRCRLWSGDLACTQLVPLLAGSNR